MKKHAAAVAPILLLLLLLAGNARAQDKHFTQFYAMPLALNPALTGNMESRYRINTIYRDQWRQVLDNPINTFAVGSDLRFDAPFRALQDDAVGVGIMFFNDKVRVIDFSTTQIALSLAYHKALDTDGRQYLSLGLQGGLTQRNVNYASLNFEDMFDGLTGYTGLTGEELPENNFAYGDWNVGLNYTARFNRYGAIFTGFALHHIAEPQISFFDNGGTGNRLFRKYSAQASAQIPLTRDNRTSILPRVLWASQGPHMEINTGANLRFALGEYGGTALQLGTWARTVRNDGSVGLDALVALAGVELGSFMIGLSYDVNLRAIQAGQRQTAFEISLTYLGNYDNEEILCPKF
jgi:type IX secretion system PorP/SprF family membrane protein